MAHSIDYKPYTLTWDGQWTVKKMIAKQDGIGDREVLVGYYAYLDDALKYGVIQDNGNTTPNNSPAQLVARMERMWEDIKTEAKTWPAIPMVTRLSTAPATGATEDESQAQTESSTEDGASDASSPSKPNAVLPENKPPRKRSATQEFLRTKGLALP